MLAPVRVGPSLLCVAVFAAATLPAQRQPVQVYLLAGQSNMDGYGGLEALAYQARHGDDDRREVFAHLVGGDGFAGRDDVWITFRDRVGPLTAGFGVGPHMMGVEWEFGNVVGDFHDAKVLLIKTSWGGASLRRKFRPPSSAAPTALIDAELAKKRAEYDKQKAKQKADTTAPKPPERAAVAREYGANYTKMLNVVHRTLADLGSVIPSYDGEGYEIAGFVWFQGWNDQYGGAHEEYATHLAHLIRDVRREFDAPDLPVVVGQMGQDGSDDARRARGLPPIGDVRRAIKAAQAAVCAREEFRGTTAVVATDRFWDWQAQAVFDKGWKEYPEEWKRIGANFPYHYLGSPYFFAVAGRAFGEAMVGLHGERSRRARPGSRR